MKGGIVTARRKLRFRLRQKPGEKGIFLPESVLKSLTNATESELKLLIILAKEGRDKDYLSESDILPACENAGIDKDSFVEALAFFRGAGLVENEEKEASVPAKPIAESKEAVVVTKDESSPARETRRSVSRPKSYTSLELAGAAENREFLELVDFTAVTLKKTLNRSDITTLYSFVDSLLLPYDVIMLGIEHCVTEGKMSLGYVEKLLCDFADREINTYELAEEYIRTRALYKSFEGKIRTKLGLGQRSLTAKEKAMIATWQTEWKTSDELLDLAYEKTVEKTGKASMSYMNKILENWYTAGFKTRAEVEMGDVKPSISGESSFDPDEFFRIAVEHSKNKQKEQMNE